MKYANPNFINNLTELYGKAFPNPKVPLTTNVNDFCIGDPKPVCCSGLKAAEIDVKLNIAELHNDCGC